jgi:hydrogenase maturation protease
VSRADLAVAGAVLIGIGNRYRRDDGIGPVLAAAVQQAGLPGVTVIESDGEPSLQLDAWSQAPLGVVVDAVLCTPPEPERIHQTVFHPESGDHDQAGRDLAAAEAPGAGAASTRGLGVPEAVRLALVLGRLPRCLVEFAVEAADLGFGTELSPAVAACLPELTRVVLAELPASRRP